MTVSAVVGLAVLLLLPNCQAQQPQLPTPGDDESTESTQAVESETGIEQTDSVDHLDGYVSPSEIVRKAYLAPPEAKQISTRRVWIDREKHRVYVDGYIAMRDGPLEMFACPMGTKEHESIVGTLAKASEVHAALLAVGAKPGTPVQYIPSFVPATGQRIRVWVCYLDNKRKFQVVDARKWIRKTGTEQEMKADWVFAGSGFYKDPSDGREYYRADGGDMICVSNFSTAMMDVPFASSAEADDLIFSPFTKRIPERGKPVRLVLSPIPLKTDKPEAKPYEVTKPEAEILPLNEAPAKAGK